MIAFGIDVSHHQDPAKVPWEKIAETARVCVVRFTYGAQLRDKHAVEHVRRARAAGLQVGAYHFFRDIHPVADQLAAFKAQAEACGYGIGDVCPWLDVELDPIPSPGRHPTPEWSPKAFELYWALKEHFGACGIYTSANDWKSLGSPEWVTTTPLWVPHYTKAEAPSTPGGALPLIWQHRVGPYDPIGPGGYYPDEPGLILDQNRVYGTLPVATRRYASSALPVTVPQTGDDDGWQELRARAMATQVSVAESVVSSALSEMSRDTEPCPPPSEEPRS